MKFGLTQHIIDGISSILEQYTKVDKAFIFGSRAKGNYRPDSDIDIAITGQDITYKDITSISIKIDDLNIGLSVDLLDYHSINEPALKEHIDRVGIEFYSRWKEYRFCDLFQIPLKNGLTKPSRIRGTGLRMVNMKEIFGYDKIDDNVTMELVPISTNELSSLLKFNDLLFARQSLVESGAGKISIYKGQKLDTVFESHLMRCRLNKSEANPDFIYYLFKSPIGKGIVSTIVTQTAAAGIKGSDLKNLQFIIPPLSEQTAIASILSSLDDKIDLLHRQNRILEQLAETMFRQWFVEEAEGSITLGEIAKVSTGKGLKRNEFIENGLYPILGANGEIGRTNNYLTDEMLILTGRVGTLGEVKISRGKVWISDNVLIINPNESKYFYPIYFSLTRIEFENMNVGSTQPLITQTDLKKNRIKISE